MLLTQLIIGHIFGDFIFQNDFMSTWKNPHKAVDKKIGQEDIWWLMLTYHAMIHGFIVTWLTDYPLLGMVEFIVHWIIDLLKMEKYYGFKTDQYLHLSCKVLWYLLIGVVR